MCGIVGAVTQRNVYKILIEGLRRLEYRGYDSAGLSIIDNQQTLQTRKNIGKVAELVKVAEANPVSGFYRYLPYSLGDSWRAKQPQFPPTQLRRCLSCPQWHY